MLACIERITVRNEDSARAAAAVAAGKATLPCPATVQLCSLAGRALKPKARSARTPTSGAPSEAIAPSKERSKAYTTLRRWGGTISAKMGLLQAVAAHVMVSPIAHSTAA